MDQGRDVEQFDQGGSLHAVQISLPAQVGRKDREDRSQVLAPVVQDVAHHGIDHPDFRPESMFKLFLKKLEIFDDGGHDLAELNLHRENLLAAFGQIK